MTDAPKDKDGDHFPDFRTTILEDRIEALENSPCIPDLEKRVATLEADKERPVASVKWVQALEERITLLENAAERKSQCAVNEALEGYFASFSSTARHRVIMALREALK